MGMFWVQSISAQEERAEIFINNDLEITKTNQDDAGSVFLFNSSMTIINYRSEVIELKFPTSCTFEIGINVSLVDSKLETVRKHRDVCAPVETIVTLDPGQNNFSVSGSILISKWDDKILPDGRYVLFVTRASYDTPTKSDYSILNPEIFDNYGVILIVNNGEYSFEFNVDLDCACAYNPGEGAIHQRLSYPSSLFSFLGVFTVVIGKLVSESRARKKG